MPANETGRKRGIEEIEFSKKRARDIQKPFNVNSLELKMILEHMDLTDSRIGKLRF